MSRWEGGWWSWDGSWMGVGQTLTAALYIGKHVMDEASLQLHAHRLWCAMICNTVLFVRKSAVTQHRSPWLRGCSQRFLTWHENIMWVQLLSGNVFVMCSWSHLMAPSGITWTLTEGDNNALAACYEPINETWDIWFGASGTCCLKRNSRSAACTRSWQK